MKFNIGDLVRIKNSNNIERHVGLIIEYPPWPFMDDPSSQKNQYKILWSSNFFEHNGETSWQYEYQLEVVK